jgi:hypothetical protein
MLKRIAIACMLTAFFLSCLFGIWVVQRLSQQPPQTPRVHTQQQPKNSVDRQQDAGEGPPGLKDQTGQTNSEHRSENASEVTIFYVRPGEWLIGFVTLLLWVSTQLLVREAKATSRRQLRAYVFLDPVKEFTFARKMSTTETIEVEIHVKNLGATPAHEIVGFTWMHLDVWPLPKTFPFTGPVEGEPSAKFVLPPGAMTHYHTGSARPLTAEEMAAVENGDLSIYIFGRIEYKDAFNHPHWTNFCQGSTALSRDGFTTTWAKCDRHNDADNN